MTQQDLDAFARSRGLTCLGPTVVGTWNGWPFTATLRPGRMNVLSASFSFAKGPSASAVRQTRKRMPQGCALTLQKGKVDLICSARDEQIESVIQAGMDMVTELLRSSAALSAVCALCRRGECDGLAIVGGGYVPVHQRCCVDRSNSAVAKAEMNTRTGNYLTGWIGALLGGFVGMLPSALAAMLIERVSLWLCILIPLAAYYGYKLFRGRMDRMVTVAAVVSSLFQVFAMEQLLFYAAVVQELHLWPSIFASIGLYFDMMPVSDMVADMAIPLIFVVLGLFCVSGIIKRTNANETLDASVLLDSMTDLQGRPLPRREPEPASQPIATWGNGPTWTQPAAPVQTARPFQEQQAPVQPRVQPPVQQPPVQAPVQAPLQTPVEETPAQPVWSAQEPVQPVWEPAQPVQEPAWSVQDAPVQPAQDAPVQPSRPAAPEQTAWSGTARWGGEGAAQEPERPSAVPTIDDLPDLPDLPELPDLEGPKEP